MIHPGITAETDKNNARVSGYDKNALTLIILSYEKLQRKHND